MKVLLVNGSAHEQGCTYTALCEISRILKEEGISSEIFQLGNEAIHDCSGCKYCKKAGKCIHEDGKVNEFILKAKEFDGFVFGTPVYYAHPSGRILSFLDRVFAAGRASFLYKPAFSIASSRRTGGVCSYDVLNKYFGVSNMPIVSGNYWNDIHGGKPSDTVQDEEGMQTMRVLARNMVWIMKCLDCAKENGINPPKLEEKIFTSYIR